MNCRQKRTSNYYSVFLPRYTMRCAVLVIAILSVCHTRGLCPHGSTYYDDFFTVWHSPMILVYEDIRFRV